MVSESSSSRCRCKASAPRAATARPNRGRRRSRSRAQRDRQIDHSRADRQSHAAVRALVQPRARGEKALLLGCGRRRRPRSRRRSDGRCARRREVRAVRPTRDPAAAPTPGCMVRSSPEMKKRALPSVGIPVRAARRIEQRFVHALAGFARHAVVAGGLRKRKRIEGRVGLVDEQRPAAYPRLRSRVERDRSRKRLLDVERALGKTRQLRGRVEPLLEARERVEVRILLVAVERHRVRCKAVEDGGDIGEPGDVGIGIAAELELEIRVAVRRDDLPQRARQGVLGRRIVIEWIEHAHGVARRDAGPRLQRAQKAIEIEAMQVGGQRCVDAGRVGAHGVSERCSQRAAQRIEHGAVEHRGAEVRRSAR